MTFDWFVMGTVVAILLTPGPTNTLLMAAGTRSGVPRSIPLLAAELTGYVSAIATIELMLGGSLRATTHATAVLRVVSAIYLLFLAWKTWRAHRAARPLSVSFGQVFVTTLFNPKAVLFASILLPLGRDRLVPFLCQFSIIAPMIGTLWICAGSSAARLGGFGVSTLVPRLTSIALLSFSAVLITAVIRS